MIEYTPRFHRPLLAMALGAALCISSPANAQSDAAMPAAATELSLPDDIRLADLPNDNGTGLVVTWTHDPDALPETVYSVGISESPDGPFYYAARATIEAAPYVAENRSIFGWMHPNGDTQFLSISAYVMPPATQGESLVRVPIEAGKSYYARYTVISGDVQVDLATTLSAKAAGNWFRWNKLNNFVFMLSFASLILLFIELARRNPNMYIRKIAGLDAVEEALGRATEMGKPVYFVHGLEDMDHISTIAAVNVLGRVAGRAIEYDTSLRVMNCRPVVMAVSREVVQQAAVEVGRPDAYNEEDVMFVASEQFSYAAAVDGMMVRERPATVLLMGYFYAESLLFAETGSHIGAIQIAGTDAYTQLPFFVTTCDYTLMGEELYAASAYLSREPRLLGSLRGQDVGKAIILATLALGAILEFVGIHWITNLVMPL